VTEHFRHTCGLHPARPPFYKGYYYIKIFTSSQLKLFSVASTEKLQEKLKKNKESEEIKMQGRKTTEKGIRVIYSYS
jgi:hypothetical protein